MHLASAILEFDPQHHIHIYTKTQEIRHIKTLRKTLNKIINNVLPIFSSLQNTKLKKLQQNKLSHFANFTT